MSEFSHLKNKLLAEQVEDEIYHYILDTPLEPGAKLPNEFELGEKFGVGRSTVREAVKLLSSKGIVEVRRGSGTYVVTTAKGLSDPLNLRSVQDKNALALDLVNVRLLLEPGTKLPNEFELGEKFGVGRSTVREAVKLLSSKGIVEVRRGSGTYVVTTAKGLSDPLNLRSVQDKNALALDLVNVRLLLEPGIAEMAALNASDEDIERIQRLCDRVESKIHSGDLYIEDDIAFHTCIAESSKNMVVEQLIPIIDTAVMMFVNVTHKKLTEETILTHRMITEAIARHDPIGARSAMVMHLNFNRNCIRKLYDGEWET